MAEESRGDDCTRVGGKLLVTGELLLHEAVVRLVFVERTHDPVAVAPGFLPLRVFVKAFTLGVARQVQPMPGPPFAIVRRREQTVDQAFVCAGDVSAKKRSCSPSVGGNP